MPPIKAISAIIATLDVLNSFALAAASANQTYVRPEMLPSDAQELRLVQCRHPCLETQEGINYIANDAHFTKGIYLFINQTNYIKCNPIEVPIQGLVQYKYSYRLTYKISN